MKHQLKDSQYILTREQVKKVIDSIEKHRDRLIVKMLAYMGIRREEVVNITYGDIDFKEKLIRVGGKGNKDRFVPITGDIKTDIITHLKGRKRGYLFPARLKKASPLDMSRVNSLLTEIGKKTGVTNPNPKIKNLNPHIFRHTFARLCIERGMDWPTLRDILGHTTVTTTIDVYASSPIKKIQQDYNKVMAFA